MKRLITLVGVTIVATALSVNAWASVEWQVLQEFKTPVTPLDVAISPDGKLTFVLGENGKIFVYAPGGVLRDNFQVDPTVDGIKVINEGQNLLLSDSKTNKLKMISVAFQAEIDTAGSPIMGKENAPIVISVFSDFQ